MKNICWLSLAIIISSCTSKEKTPLTISKSLSEKLDSLMATVGQFNGVVLVAEKGVPVYHKAFGYLEYETKTKLDTGAVFELASVSKQFTAFIIMILKEEGKLNYDDPLDKFVPGLPYPGISIRNLLNHTSGLPDYQEMMNKHWDKTKIAGNDDILAYLKKYHPDKLFEPGTRYVYSNTGYVLLGSIAEKASGKDFIEFCRERIFKPLKMTFTDIRGKNVKDTMSNFAHGYIFVSNKNRYMSADSFPSSNYTIWLGNRKGPGRISSTTSDLLKWDQALYTDQLLKPETLKDAYIPTHLKNDSTSNYGFGWWIDKDPHHGTIVYHTGDNPGYKTLIVRYLDENKTIIVLSNNATELLQIRKIF